VESELQALLADMPGKQTPKVTGERKYTSKVLSAMHGGGNVDSESRKSTAMSEEQTPLQRKRGTSAERTQRIVKEASKEAFVLSLDPTAAKRRKKP
jgi:hypothetical protein